MQNRAIKTGGLPHQQNVPLLPHDHCVFRVCSEIRSAFLECAAALDSFTLSRSLIQGRSLSVYVRRSLTRLWLVMQSLQHTHVERNAILCVFFFGACPSGLRLQSKISPMPHDSRKVSVILTAELICHFRAALCTRKVCT